MGEMKTLWQEPLEVRIRFFAARIVECVEVIVAGNQRATERFAFLDPLQAKDRCLLYTSPSPRD